MLDLLARERRPTLLLATAKVIGVVGLLSVAASHWLAGQSLDQGGLARLAAFAAQDAADPSSTGSIEKARTQKLDPCALPANRR